MVNRSIEAINQKKLAHNITGSKFRLSIPNAITLMRLLALPHLIWAFNHEIVFAAYLLFLFSIGSDLADGYLSRKIGAITKFGANLDTAVDFVFISGMYMAFILKGIYSLGILFLIIFMFVQFTLTNLYSKETRYDPIGKFYGSLLFGGIGLTLLFPTEIMYLIVTTGIVISTIATLLSRLTIFWKNKT
jgi:phosphatidylglycerophosphate synthase